VTPRRVEIDIERLVLDGVDARDPRRLAAAVERELARLIARDGMPERPALSETKPNVDGGTVSPPQGAGAEGLGRAVAGALHRGIGR
jgi:hypothetical protein